MDSACPGKDATEILSDSHHSTKVAPTTLTIDFILMQRNLLQGDHRWWSSKAEFYLPLYFGEKSHPRHTILRFSDLLHQPRMLLRGQLRKSQLRDPGKEN